MSISKFNITDTMLNIEVPMPKLSKKRLMKLNHLKTKPVTDLLAWIDSLNGKRIRGLEVNDIFKNASHRQQVKYENNRNMYLNEFMKQFKYFGSSPRPKETLAKGLALGIEIECLVPSNGDPDEYGDCDCDYEDDAHSDDCASNSPVDCGAKDDIAALLKEARVKNVSITEDGSINEERGYKGLEFRCLTRIDDMDNLKRLCEVLNKVGAKVDTSTGLHVHLDLRGEMTPNFVAKRIQRMLPLLTLMLPKSRINNRFCALDVSEDDDRYAKINKLAFSKYKTLEIRMHSGTTDFEKISQWCKILHKIAFNDCWIPNNVLDINLVANRFNFELSTISYMFQRISKFNPNEAKKIFKISDPLQVAEIVDNFLLLRIERECEDTDLNVAA